MKTSMLKTWVLMKISVLFAIAVFVAIAGQRTAQAQRYTNYPFCAVFDPQMVSCSFNTMAQCLATTSGRGGFCEANVDYAPAATKSRRQRSKL